MTIAFAFFIVVILTVIFFNPKLGTFLIWPILFTYPHGWWYHQGFLPLNIGYDDLFFIVLFIVVFVRRNLMGGIPFRFGYGFWVITAFIGVVTLAGFSGAMDWPAYRFVILKEVLKVWVFWCLFYAVIHCVDDEKDLQTQLIMFSAAAVLGAGLVIFQYFVPSLAWPWQLPEAAGLGGQAISGTIGEEEETRRAYGAFMNANSAACVLVCSFVLLLGILKLQKNIWKRFIGYLFAFLLLVAVLVTKSRSGFLMLAAVLFLMALFGQNKKLSWLAIGLFIIVLFLFAGTRKAFFERLSDIYNPASKEVSSNVLGRVELWKRYFSTMNLKIFILGQGSTAGIILNETESHSMYVSLITVYGLSGLIWAMSSLCGFLKRVVFVRCYSTSVLLWQIATVCLWTVFSWGIYAGTSDALSSNYPRYLLFFLVVLIDRTFELCRQQERLVAEGSLDSYGLPDWEADKGYA